MLIVLVALIITGTQCSEKNAIGPRWADPNNTQYLAFQLFVSGSTEPIGNYQGLNPFISPAQIEEFFRTVQAEVGPSMCAYRKPAIIIGPIALDFSNGDITNLINLSFELSNRYDIAVGFHLDDGKFWANRPDLWKNPDNIEWIDWNGTPNTSSDVSWVSTRLAPQMCFNAPLVKIAVNDFVSNIAIAIKSNLDQLAQSNKGYLFAGTIVGWEPGIYPDRDTHLPSGYHALARDGFDPNHPGDIDQERVNILHQYIEWMSEPLVAIGLPVNKLYSHTVFLPKYYYDSLSSINPDFSKRSYAEVNNFSLPELALGNDYMPGFSTYPLTGVLEEVHSLVNKRGWASSEGTNLIPFMPPVTTGYGMESYLARHYNYGCSLVNIFAFHLRGDPFTDALNNASEGPDAIAAYKKFLSGARLIE
jgi:hypothetical protein